MKTVKLLRINVINLLNELIKDKNVYSFNSDKLKEHYSIESLELLD